MNYTQDILNLINDLELLRVAELKKFGSIALVLAFIAFIFFIKFRSNFLPVLGLIFFILAGSYYYLNNNYKTKVEVLNYFLTRSQMQIVMVLLS